jgi:hypothetical protein
MSHFSTLRTKITDAEILKSSLRDLGISVNANADVRGYNGQRVRAEIVATLEGDYDLGWSRNGDGSFRLPHFYQELQCPNDVLSANIWWLVIKCLPGFGFMFVIIALANGQLAG